MATTEPVGGSGFRYLSGAIAVLLVVVAGARAVALTAVRARLAGVDAQGARHQWSSFSLSSMASRSTHSASVIRWPASHVQREQIRVPSCAVSGVADSGWVVRASRSAARVRRRSK